MGSVLESSYIRRRLQEMDQIYPEPNTFGACDCSSYTYFALSAAMFSIGTYITVLALGDIRGYIFSSLGHMWLIGPIFICSGIMISVKSVLYLRRKSVVQMLLRQRVLLRVLQQMAQQTLHQNQTIHSGGRNASTLTLPPSYEALLEGQTDTGSSNNQELPPPSYEEAMFLIGDEKLKLTMEEVTKHTLSSDSLGRLPDKDEEYEGSSSCSPPPPH